MVFRVSTEKMFQEIKNKINLSGIVQDNRNNEEEWLSFSVEAMRLDLGHFDEGYVLA